jgi:hypothetical protein
MHRDVHRSTIRVAQEAMRASLADRLEPEASKNTDQSIRADLRKRAQCKSAKASWFGLSG